MLKIAKCSSDKRITEINESFTTSYTREKSSVETPSLSNSTSGYAESAPAWRRQRLSLLTSTSRTALARIAAQSSPAESLAFDRLFYP